MPLLYGEGRKAFHRLQQAIISQSDDESVFAWLSNESNEPRGVLADSPAEFLFTGHVRSIEFEHKRPPAVFTSRGLEMYHTISNSFIFPPGLEKFCIYLFGGSVRRGAEVIELRLDCEYADTQGKVRWVGLLLCRDLTNGTWYRPDASKLLYARQKRHFRKIYPAFVSFKKIYVADVRGNSIRSSGSRPDPKSDLSGNDPSQYSVSVVMNLLWQLAHITSGSFYIWLVSASHHYFGLEDPNGVLSWAYLTAAWHLQGQHTEILAGVMILGMCGWGFDSFTYASRSLFTALLSLLPMLLHEKYLDMFQWEALPDRM